mgnify:CR=1 FL=1
MIGSYLHPKSSTEGLSAKKALWVGVFTNLFGLFFRMSRLVFFVFLPRLLSVEALGTYFLVNGFVEVVNGFSCLGLEHGSMRWIRSLLSKGHVGSVRAHLRRILLLAFFLSGLVTLAIVFAAPAISSMLTKDASLAGIVRLFAFRLPVLAVTTVALSASRAKINMSVENFVKAIYEPVALTVLGLSMVYAIPDLRTLAWVQVGVDSVGMIVTLYLVFSSLPKGDERPVPIDWGFLSKNSVFIGLPASLNFLKSKIDLFLVGRLLDLRLVGIYGVCLELANSIKKIRYLFDPVVTPLAQKLAEEGKHEELQETVERVVTWILVPTFLAAGSLMVAPGFFLSWFGPSFDHGASVLMILMVGQIFYAGLGISEMVFAAVGRLLALVVKAIGLIALTVVLTIPLVQFDSIRGAALANSAALIVVNVIRYRYALTFLGIRFLTRNHMILSGLFLLGLAAAALLPQTSAWIHMPIFRVGAFLLVFSVTATFAKRRGVLQL